MAAACWSSYVRPCTDDDEVDIGFALASDNTILVILNCVASLLCKTKNNPLPAGIVIPVNENPKHIFCPH